MTGGSSSTWAEFDRYRTVGATATEMLVARRRRALEGAGRRAAAPRTASSPTATRSAQLRRARRGGRGSCRRRTSVEAEGPEGLEAHRHADAPARHAREDHRQGAVRHRRAVPGLRTALVARPPAFGAKVRLRRRRGANGAGRRERGAGADAASRWSPTHFWAAKAGRDALDGRVATPEGDAGADTDKLRADYRALGKEDRARAVAEKGDVDGGLTRRAEALRRPSTSVPYLAHAPMEPLNCTVKIDGDRCEIWTGTQFQTVDQSGGGEARRRRRRTRSRSTPRSSAAASGGAPTRASDFVAEAVHVAKAAGVPVKVVWTREDDMRGGYYRPRTCTGCGSALDDDGQAGRVGARRRRPVDPRGHAVRGDDQERHRRDLGRGRSPTRRT